MVSNKLKFIFTHINKTGGTSIASILDEYCENTRYKHQFVITKDYHPEWLPSAGMEEDCLYPLNSYFKFSVLRNPWDKLVSNWSKVTEDPKLKHISFRDWLLNRSEIKGFYFKNCLAVHPQIDWISDKNGEVCVDFICRFENLQDDFNIVCEKIGIPQQKLPHENPSMHKHYSEYYNDETKVFVEDYFEKDIKIFNYEFEE